MRQISPREHCSMASMLEVALCRGHPSTQEPCRKRVDRVRGRRGALYTALTWLALLLTIMVGQPAAQTPSPGTEPAPTPAPGPLRPPAPQERLLGHQCQHSLIGCSGKRRRIASSRPYSASVVRRVSLCRRRCQKKSPITLIRLVPGG